MCGDPLPDLEWFTPDGRQMAGDDWGNDFGRAVALFVNGEGIPERGPYGQRHLDDSFLILFNAHDGALDFSVPGDEFGKKWQQVLGTAEPDPVPGRVFDAGAVVTVPDRSLVVLERMV